MKLFTVIFRTIFFYFFVTVSYRIMGKREVGQLGIIDLIVSILIAELVAISIENTSGSLLLTVIPISILVLLEILLAYMQIKSKKVRNVLQGKTSAIICEGKINYHELIRQRYTLDDLLINLRQNSIKSIEEVEYAFLEPNGKLSIFKYSTLNKVYPLPFIIDGKINDDSLKKANIKHQKLLELLYESNLDLNEVFYAFYKEKKIFVIKKDKSKSFLDNKTLKIQ